MSGGIDPCTHRRARRISASVEWCAACGAYRVAAEWVLPELAAQIPDVPALSSANVALDDAIQDANVSARAGAQDAAARAVRLEAVATFLANLPPS